ncbi:hypothetical protein HZH66_007635 [Vespula vulgaris]|uniref:DOMON domain-containing protein n=1 Tax=Vespula vulgaris TaxID=7454 RepID=A0A834JY39_VESVU|nr:hypothetical protein HZH66_007635 [Vespula vulgaris]
MRSKQRACPCESANTKRVPRWVVSKVLSLEPRYKDTEDSDVLSCTEADRRDKEVTFEIQVKTLGYVGLGFKKEDGREGADMVIGWVDNNGQVHLQKFNSIVCFSSTIVFHVGAGIKSIDIVGTIGQIGAIILD